LEWLEIEIESWYQRSRPVEALIGLRNMVQVARLIATAALDNPQSQGCHYRLPDEEAEPLFGWLLQPAEPMMV
jgi:aspartate oxidase